MNFLSKTSLLINTNYKTAADIKVYCKPRTFRAPSIRRADKRELGSGDSPKKSGNFKLINLKPPQLPFKSQFYPVIIALSCEPTLDAWRLKAGRKRPSRSAFFCSARAPTILCYVIKGSGAGCRRGDVSSKNSKKFAAKKGVLLSIKLFKFKRTKQ